MLAGQVGCDHVQSQATAPHHNNVVWRTSTLLNGTARCHNGFLLVKPARRVLDGWLEVVWPSSLLCVEVP